MLLSGSRDKNLIIWNLTRDEQAYGYPKRSLEGHSHIVSDCVCSTPLLPTGRHDGSNWATNTRYWGQTSAIGGNFWLTAGLCVYR